MRGLPKEKPQIDWISKVLLENLWLETPRKDHGNKEPIPLTIQKRQKLKYLDHEIKLTVKIITHLVLKIPNTITMGELFMCCTNFW